MVPILQESCAATGSVTELGDWEIVLRLPAEEKDSSLL